MVGSIIGQSESKDSLAVRLGGGGGIIFIGMICPRKDDSNFESV